LWFRLESVVKISNSKLSEFELGWPRWLSHHKSNSWLNPWLAIYGSLHPGKGFKPNFHCFFSFFCLMEVFSTCWCEGTVTKPSKKRLPGQGELKQIFIWILDSPNGWESWLSSYYKWYLFHCEILKIYWNLVIYGHGYFKYQWKVCLIQNICIYLFYIC